MAEIRIERKPRRRAGAVILLIVALLVILAVWYWQTQVTTVGSLQAAPHATVALANALIRRAA